MYWGIDLTKELWFYWIYVWYAIFYWTKIPSSFKLMEGNFSHLKSPVRHQKVRGGRRFRFKRGAVTNVFYSRFRLILHMRSLAKFFMWTLRKNVRPLRKVLNEFSWRWKNLIFDHCFDQDQNNFKNLKISNIFE